MLVMFTEDTMVFPNESEWFQQLEDNMKDVQPIEDSAFYKEDWLGFKELDEAKKIVRVSIVGDHLQFSQADVDKYFVPFLMS